MTSLQKLFTSFFFTWISVEAEEFFDDISEFICKDITVHTGNIQWCQLLLLWVLVINGSSFTSHNAINKVNKFVSQRYTYYLISPTRFIPVTPLQRCHMNNTVLCLWVWKIDRNTEKLNNRRICNQRICVPCFLHYLINRIAHSQHVRRNSFTSHINFTNLLTSAEMTIGAYWLMILLRNVVKTGWVGEGLGQNFCRTNYLPCFV